MVLADGALLTDLLPQKPPMVMVHQLLQADAALTVSGFSVTDTCPLLEDVFLSEAGLVENIAQTAAAGVGYAYKQEQKEAPVGFIAAIKDLKITNLPRLGAALRTEVQVQNQVMEFSIIRGRVFENEALLAECEMRIFLKP